MTTQLDKIEGKIDKMDERLDRVDVSLASQGATLTEHVRRTDLLEGKIESHEEKIAAEIKPIKEHVALVGAIAKIAAALGALTALAVGIKELFS